MKQILQKIKMSLMVAPALLLSFAFVTAVPMSVGAACDPDAGITGAVNDDCTKGSGQQSELIGDDGIVTTVINIMLFIIGLLCVIMIIFGGIRYTTSNGDTKKVTDAKNTILYAVVGLVVAIVAYALVAWIVSLLAAND